MLRVLISWAFQENTCTGDNWEGLAFTTLAYKKLPRLERTLIIVNITNLRIHDPDRFISDLISWGAESRRSFSNALPLSTFEIFLPSS
jgi:hypothetical protein